MTQGPGKHASEVDRLIKAITDKLEANRSVLAQSLRYVRLGWRTRDKDGEIEVDLEPKI